MSKKHNPLEERDPGEIPESEWIPDLEKIVSYHVARIGQQFPRFTKKYSRTPYPEKFESKQDELNFQLEEIRKCIEGDGTINGKMYFWFNYCHIFDAERGKIRPDFRVIDHEWFKLVEDCQNSKTWGIVSIKRRRIGASWRAAADILHDCVFKKHFRAGMNSKTETDSRNLFKNVKYIFQNLPDWMRPQATASDRRDFMDFSYYVKDANGNRIRKGNESSVYSVAPVPSAHEGSGVGKIIMDESGKYNVLDLWQFAEDCLKVNTRRVGIPIIFGTVGDITKEGRGLLEMWKNADVYKLKRFGQWGYNGLICDEFGNDRITEAVRFIIYERERLKPAAKKVRETFLQKYPLTEKDAFNISSSGGIGDSMLIAEQLQSLIENPPKSVKGWMRRKPDGGVDFVPNEEGKIIIYHRPDDRVNGYVAAIDTIEDDDVEKTRDTSNMSFSIMSKPFGTDPELICVEYIDRPLKIDTAFEQVAMLLQWYHNLPVTIEMNKGGWRMKKYFETHYPKLIALAPAAAMSAKGGVAMQHGVKMTANRKEQMIGLIEEYIDNHSKFIPSIAFLEACKVFGDAHGEDDAGISVGWCLILIQSDKSVVKRKGELLAANPTVNYIKQGSTVQLVAPQQQNQRQKYIKPKSALFKFK